jgi:hypothetical protein
MEPLPEPFLLLPLPRPLKSLSTVVTKTDLTDLVGKSAFP